MGLMAMRTDTPDTALLCFNTGLQIISLMQKVLGEYQSLTTGVMITASTFRIQAEPILRDRKGLMDFIRKTEKALEVTVGKDHPMFSRFQMIKQNFGRRR